MFKLFPVNIHSYYFSSNPRLGEIKITFSLLLFSIAEGLQLAMSVYDVPVGKVISSVTCFDFSSNPRLREIKIIFLFFTVFNRSVLAAARDDCLGCAGKKGNFIRAFYLHFISTISISKIE